MDVLLIRHAKALEKGGVPDAHRPLTAHGRRDALELGEALRRAAVTLDAIVTSPLVRAVETAALLAVGLSFGEALEVAPELKLDESPRKVIENVILPRAELGAVALVGHEPQLGLLLGLLLGAPAPSPRKSTAIRISWSGDEAAARFHWVLRPGMSAPSTRLADVG